MRAQPEKSHFINGQYVEDTSGTPLPVIWPAKNEVIARLHSATPGIIELAISAARAAQPRWAAMAPVERGRVLRRAADIIRARNHDLSVLETLDTGKPMQETLAVDATSAADALEYFGGLSAAITGETIKLGGDWVYTTCEPLGICAGIGAWNYPTQISCWKGAPALVCGNAMIFKPSETTPLCALKIAEIFMEAGAPAGIFNVIQGYGDVGAALSTHPDIDKISLTGSVPTGRKVFAAAGAGIKHVTMELGGKSPILIFDDADIEDAVGGAMLGNFYSSGQVCSNGTRVYVQEGLHDRFLERLKTRTEAIRLGDPLDEDTQMGPLVSEAQLQKVWEYIEIGRREAQLVSGGTKPELPGLEGGFFVSPTIFAGVSDNMRIAREEIFGPVMSVMKFASEEEGIRRANDTEFGLSAGVFTRDLARAHRVIAQLNAGSCWINSYNLAPVEAPFGGVAASGVGRENSKAAIGHYSQIKSVYVGMGPVESPY